MPTPGYFAFLAFQIVFFTLGVPGTEGVPKNFKDVLRYEKEIEDEFRGMLAKPQILERDWKTLTGAKPNRLYDGVYQFSWKSCGTGAEPMTLKALSVSPDPVVVPGKVLVSFDGITNDVVNSSIQIDVTMKKKVAFMWITVPCMDNIGSCTYTDICSMIPEPCPWAKDNVPCKCPVKPGEYVVNNGIFQIPKISLPSWLATGDFYVKVVGSLKSAQVFCYEVNISLKFN